MAWAPLLTTNDLRRVRDIEMSQFSLLDAEDIEQDCAVCSQRVAMSVEIAMHYNDTVVQFAQAGGVVVTVQEGRITVQRLDALDPTADPSEIYEACAEASCSSIRISGIDVEALRQQAEALEYNGGGRRSAGKAKQCKQSAGKRTEKEPP